MLKGMEQLEKTLRETERKLRSEVLKKALVTAVQPLVRQAAISAPSRSGKLSRSMATQVISAPLDEAAVRVGPGRPEGSHGILLEHGTVFMTPQPFLGNAFETTQAEIEEIMGNLFNEFLSREEING